MNSRKKSLISLMLFLLTLVVNFLGSQGYINGNSQKDVSDKYLTLITPAPSTFAIWGLIYVLLLAFIIRMFISWKQPYYQKLTHKISPLLWLSFLFNMLWIVAFSYEWIGLSLAFIAGLLVSLCLICLIIGYGRADKWFPRLVMGIYTGWLVIATLANVALFLVKIQWQGLGISQIIWAMIMLGIGIALAILLSFGLKNPFLPWPIAWAYFGIYRFHKSMEGFGGIYPQISTVALIGIGILLIVSPILFIRKET